MFVHNFVPTITFECSVSWTLTYILCKKDNKILWKSITCFVINCHSHLLEGTLLDYCLFCSGLHFPSPFALSVRSHCFQLCVISLVSSSIYTLFIVSFVAAVFSSVTLCSGTLCLRVLFCGLHFGHCFLPVAPFLDY